ncbi:MAG TPA: alpha/beta hydrolase [Microscillaceae bacterium]|nr:alpha/beta hydrolase [Microscillaceae bacterium]
MIVKKEMYDKELQAQYNQYRFLVSINSKRWSLRLMNRLVRLTKGQKLKGVINETHFVSSTTTKAHKIRTRVFRPQGVTEKLPAMLYLHGGGYMMGIPEMAMPFYSDIIKRRKVVIVSPDYRLSQKNPFPAGFNDCYDVLLWMRDNAEELNIDLDNFIVGGHSAGGGMTAAITLKVRDTKDVKLAFQMPIYPMLDYRMITKSSKMLGSTMWDANINAFAWNLYLRNLQGQVPVYASPALNEDYRGFPPTISFVGDLEPFYDENIAYIEALKSAAVPVEFKVFKGGYHGFEVGSPKTTIGKEANEFQLDAFEKFYDQYIQ